MAGMDYFNCCLCHSRIFYDACNQWDVQVFRIAQVVGLCRDCGEDHEVIVVKKATGKHKNKRVSFRPVEIEQMDFKEIEEHHKKYG